MDEGEFAKCREKEELTLGLLRLAAAEKARNQTRPGPDKPSQKSARNSSSRKTH